MKAFDYAVATTRDGALTALADGWKARAGGIDLIDRLKERTEESSRIVGLQKLDELRGIAWEGDLLTIGPLTTLREVAREATLRERFPALAEAAGDAATPQVRAMATVGGNLCQRPRCWYFRSADYPCLKKGGATCYAVDGENQFHALFGGGPCHIVHPSNLAPILVAAGAEFAVESAGKESRIIPANEFFVVPAKRMESENVLLAGDLIVAVRVPNVPARSAYVEFRQKQSFDWPLASCSVAHRNGKWHIVLGAVAPIPWPATASMSVVDGADDIDEALATKAAEAELQLARPMSGNAWRLQLVKTAIRDALLKACGKVAA